MSSGIGNTNLDHCKRPGGATDGVSLLPVCSPNPALLEVRDLDVSYTALGKTHVAVKALSFNIRAGEVLGIGGLMGAGRSGTRSVATPPDRGQGQRHRPVSRKRFAQTQRL